MWPIHLLSPVSRQLGLYHKFDTKMVHFIVLEVIPQDPRGGNWDKHILQRETPWIERFDATKAPGINEVLSYWPFLWRTDVMDPHDSW